jgi:hypothetical protein
VSLFFFGDNAAKIHRCHFLSSSLYLVCQVFHRSTIQKGWLKILRK